MINNENRAASCCEQPDGPPEEIQGSPALLPPYCNATSGNDQGLDDPVDPDHLSIPADRQAILAERLSEGHLRMLQEESAIAEDVILARGYRTITSPKELLDLGFAPTQRRVPGLLLPLHPTDGGKSPFCVYRPDQPREVATRDGQKKVLKYEVPKGSGTRLDCPPDCQPLLKDPAIPLWITEGQKKADALISQNLCAIALLGVWNGTPSRQEVRSEGALVDCWFVRSNPARHAIPTRLESSGWTRLCLQKRIGRWRR